MNELVKRGFSAYKIFLKNKLVASIMMLFSGVMMFIAALQGKGNDVYSLPILITTLGTTLASLSRVFSIIVNCGEDRRLNRIIKRVKI